MQWTIEELEWFALFQLQRVWLFINPGAPKWLFVIDENSESVPRRIEPALAFVSVRTGSCDGQK